MSKTVISQFDKETTPMDWLVEETEKWCKDRAIYIAVMDSIEVIDKKSQRSTGEIPELLKDALSVSFDQHIGHDQIEDADDRYEFYHTEEEKIPFDLEYFNKITKGGLPNKTLNICLAGTGVGKSLFMCHMASAGLMMNKNVLYITLEMSEERIAERIDANVLNIPMKELPDLSKKMFDKKVDKIRAKTKGKLIIKEYPTASAHVGHFRHLLQELEIKKDFKPDLIFIDYLNICASHRIRPGSGANSYTLVKSIAEELRGLAVEFDVPIMSATQTTRSGYGSTDIGLEDTSESFGLPATADMMFALITSDELEELDQLVVKQLKNRYNDPTVFKRFVIGVDRSRMKLYDCEQEAQEELIDGAIEDDDTPVFDRNRGAEKFQDFNV
jgi:replicative DNA helicase